MHPVERIKQLLDPARLAVAGALAVEPATSDALTERTGLDRRRVLDALGVLSAAGLVGFDDGTYRLDLEVMRATARELATVELPMDPAIGFGMTDAERVVLSRFFHGRTLHELPGNRAKRLIVLQRLALEFDVGRRYHELEVNGGCPACC